MDTQLLIFAQFQNEEINMHEWMHKTHINFVQSRHTKVHIGNYENSKQKPAEKNYRLQLTQKVRRTATRARKIHGGEEYSTEIEFDTWRTD